MLIDEFRNGSGLQKFLWLLIGIMGIAMAVSLIVAFTLVFNVQRVTEPPFELVDGAERDLGELCPGERLATTFRIKVNRPTTLLVVFNVWDPRSGSVYRAEHDPIWIVLDGAEKSPTIVEETLAFPVPELPAQPWELRVSATDYITTVPTPIIKIRFEVPEECNA